jgi:uracil permease
MEKQNFLPKMTGRNILLGFQHVFAMFGATVLVPLLTGLSVSTTLFAAGVGTLIFHFLTKGKVPVFLGSSFAFLGGFAIIAPKLLNPETGEYTVPNTEMLPYACGGVVFAGLLYVLFALLIKAFGVRHVMRFFPPVVTGPMIISIGLILAPSAIANCSTNWLLAFIALVIVIIFNIWGKGMLKIIPILLSVIITYTIALAMHQVDFSQVASANLIGSPLSRASFAKFSVNGIITIMPIALATIMEHIGDIAAVSATVGKNFIADPGLTRTLLGDGLATSFAGLIGGPANTTYGENTGVLALTKMYDAAVIRLAAVIAIILSVIPKFDAFVNTIPTAIIGGISLILYGMISAVGIRNIVENQIDFTESRNLIIAAIILVSALGFTSYGGLTFTIGKATITLSGLAIAAILGIITNAVLPGNTYEFNEGDTSKENNVNEPAKKQ